MSVNTNNLRPVFVKNPLITMPNPGSNSDFMGGANSRVVLTANTAYDGTGSVGSTLILVGTVPSGGAVLKKIFLRQLGTNIAHKVRIFINNGNSVAIGSNNTLLDEFVMTANTSSTTAAENNQLADYVGQDIVLPEGAVIYALTTVTIASGTQITLLMGGLTAS